MTHFLIANKRHFSIVVRKSEKINERLNNEYLFQDQKKRKNLELAHYFVVVISVEFWIMFLFMS